MRYYVLDDQGQKYGPADLATLNSWAAEGRIRQNTQVEDEASGLRMAASAVSGLTFPPPVAQPGPYASGTHTYSPPSVGVPYNVPSGGTKEGIGSLLLAFGMFALSLGLTFSIGTLGIYTALVGIGAGWKAKDDYPAAGWVATGLNVAAALFSLYWRTVGRR